MAEQREPDLCIIGAGAGGIAVAEAARALGASVVLIERGRLGGATLNTSSIPSKSLVMAGHLAEQMRNAQRYGIANEEPRVAARAVIEHVHDVVGELAPQVSHERLEAHGIEVIAGEARFADPRTVTVGDLSIVARRFVIATGTRPMIPDIPGLSETRYFTTETIFSNPYKLTHLVVIGAGPAGLELAQAYRRLGAEVSVIDAGRALGHVDPELVAIARGQLDREGVRIIEGASVIDVRARSQGIGVRYAAGEGGVETLDASHILIAAGRRPDVEALSLEAAGVRFDPTRPERLLVRDNLKTTNRRVYVTGDASGSLQYSHVAMYHAERVVRSALMGLPIRNRTAAIPRVVFTDPQIAEVGLSGSQARARHHGDYGITRCSFAENERARITGATYGIAKMITDRHGRILGAGVVGPGAAELIALFALAISNGLHARQLSEFVAPYPSLAQIARQLGAAYQRERGDNSWSSRLVTLRRRLP